MFRDKCNEGSITFDPTRDTNPKTTHSGQSPSSMSVEARSSSRKEPDLANIICIRKVKSVNKKLEGKASCGRPVELVHLKNIGIIEKLATESTKFTSPVKQSVCASEKSSEGFGSTVGLGENELPIDTKTALRNKNPDWVRVFSDGENTCNELSDTLTPHHKTWACCGNVLDKISGAEGRERRFRAPEKPKLSNNPKYIMPPVSWDC